MRGGDALPCKKEKQKNGRSTRCINCDDSVMEVEVDEFQALEVRFTELSLNIGGGGGDEI